MLYSTWRCHASNLILRQQRAAISQFFAVVDVSGKMGKRKFNQKWMEDDLFKRWLAPAENNDNAVCKLCKKTFSLGTMGVKAVESHMKGEKHQRSVAAASGVRLISALLPARDVPAKSNVCLDTTSQSAMASFVSPTETQKAEVL